MIVFSVLLGLFLIVVGLLVKRYPSLLAGYNNMTTDQRRNVDINGLSSFIRNCLVIMGLVLASGLSAIELFGWKISSDVFMLFVILPITAVMIIFSQRYDRNHTNRTNQLIALAVLIGVGITIFVITSRFRSQEAIYIDKGNISISGIYGLDESVHEVTLINSIPEILTRTNGYSDGPVRKGHFKLDDLGNCLLFLESDNEPYIKITTSGSPIIINRGSTDETNTLYQKLLAEFDRSSELDNK